MTGDRLDTESLRPKWGLVESIVWGAWIAVWGFAAWGAEPLWATATAAFVALSLPAFGWWTRR